MGQTKQIKAEPVLLFLSNHKVVLSTVFFLNPTLIDEPTLTISSTYPV